MLESHLLHLRSPSHPTAHQYAQLGSLFHRKDLFIWLLQVLVVACGVFCLHHGMQDLYLPDQESNPGSLPVDHQGSPYLTF